MSRPTTPRVRCTGCTTSLHAYVQWSSSRGSRVLNDMLKLGTGQERSNELQFSDTELEHSKVLELNLDHWHGLPLPGLRTHRHEIRLLILLAKKYDCPATTLALRATIRSLLLESSQSPVNICRSLATLEDVQGCASVNRMGGTRTWSGDSDLEAWTPLNNCVEGQSTFEVGSWSSNLFNGVPLRFTHALIRATIRATIGVKRPFKSRTDCDDVARTFTKILGPGESFL